jgi:hypothetical protein
MMTNGTSRYNGIPSPHMVAANTGGSMFVIPKPTIPSFLPLANVPLFTPVCTLPTTPPTSDHHTYIYIQYVV